MAFSNNLYKLRKQKGLSQDELGSKLNVSRQTVSKWELGQTTPELEKLIGISDFFDVSIDKLVMDAAESVADEVENNNVQSENTLKKYIRNIDKKKLKNNVQKSLKIFINILLIIFAVDIISMIIYFCISGVPN